MNSREPCSSQRIQGSADSDENWRGSSDSWSRHPDDWFRDGEQLQEPSRSRGRGRGLGRGRGRPHTQFHSTDEKNYHYSGSQPHGRKERQYPIGFRQLQSFLTLPPDAVPYELLSEKSGFRILLQQDDIQPDKIFLVVEVVAHAAKSQSSVEGLVEVYHWMCELKFIDRLCLFTMTLRRQHQDKAKSFFTHLHVILESFANAVKAIAIDNLLNLIDISIAVIMPLKEKEVVNTDLLHQYQELQEMLTEAAEHWKQEEMKSSLGRRKHKSEMDQLEPPDNFRDISVLPTPDDLIQDGFPFLRRNIVEGKYKDGNHYLDVQFRLLREDFVRPLRKGISEYRKYNHSRIREVRIYRNLKILYPNLKQQKLVYNVQLNVQNNINIERSKRLLYGNLVCLSSDNFNSFILGSVANRDSEDLKKGIIGIQFETETDEFDLTRNFVMAESRTYFMAYKHTLRALQQIADKGVALEPYIVRVKTSVDPPPYLFPGERYDFRVIKNSKWMKSTEAYSLFFEDEKNVQEPEEDSNVSLKEVYILRELLTWPSQRELGLDGSQCRALRSALTRQLAIVQGPPGTGKTFLGLKIVQLLLHNSQVWKKDDNPTPILVICYTNHALDQFLEGMTSYTKNIVRVGSRTQSENISKFQINYLVNGLHSNRAIPETMHDRSCQLWHEIAVLENQIERTKQVAVCTLKNGIISLKTFVDEEIIPQHVQQQLELSEGVKKLSNWLIADKRPALNPQALTVRYQERCTAKASGTSEDHSLDVEQCVSHGNENLEAAEDEHEESLEMLEPGEVSDEDLDILDTETLRKMEEQDRVVEEEILYDDGDPQSAGGSQSVDRILKIADEGIHFEIRSEDLDAEIARTGAILNETEDAEAHLVHTICLGQKQAMEIGLTLPEDPEQVMAMEQYPFLNIWQLNFPRRWQFYKYWLRKLVNKLRKELKRLQKIYEERVKARQEVRNHEYLYVMRHASIVGMTTTGAAQYNSILQDLAPAIVVIEEAAEILEAHVITSLSRECQHLIMIGDHQQLKPSATVFELATKFGLETSLFERMIKNGLAYETLEYQHRMRPCISKLLVPSVYPILKDHPSVNTYPSIRGLTKDLFFVSHQMHEKQESDDNNSHENQFEAELVIGLCRHLVLQGYSPSDITILTPYSGQFFLLRKLQRKHLHCTGVRICVVDNFQGEENKIILLSLVRSNPEGQVGFLRTENRVCVALSRAKHGLYITGNMDLLCASSDLWKKIKEDLVKFDAYGSALTIVCENHKDQVMPIVSGDDFSLKSPNGGCTKRCGASLACHHTCPQVCHLDGHEEYKCREACTKILCDLRHPCPSKCSEKCGMCKVQMKKILPCGHEHDLPCHVKPEEHKCLTILERIIPNCQHKAKMPCYLTPNLWPCPWPCDTRLDCGHKCRKTCHVKKDADHLHYDCQEPCRKLNAGCTKNHLCQKKCFQECGACIVKVTKILPCTHQAINVVCSLPADMVQCKKNCVKTLPCGHPCKKQCCQQCGDCTVLVNKSVSRCHHTVKVPCGQEATTDKCEGRCPLLLGCGHPCTARCRDPCTGKCTQLVLSTTKCPQGHPISLPCHLNNKVFGEEAWGYCRVACGKVLECEHGCTGDCGTCYQGRVHAACTQACHKPLVCGHICKQPCSADCPPCQETCQWHCSHSRCKKKCGQPCIACMELCDWTCPHKSCSNLCGDKCSRGPCTKPCKKKLQCGHGCVGYCGDPCPPLCRVCDRDQLTDILFGDEEEDDARFVLLEDCGHVIEAAGLEQWLQVPCAEIGMKCCPKCKKPIYNNRRYKHIILDTYKAVTAVKGKYFTSQEKIRRKDIELLLQSYGGPQHFTAEVKKLKDNLGIATERQRCRQKYISEGELKLYQVQAQVLKKANSILRSLYDQNSPQHSAGPAYRPIQTHLKKESKYESRLKSKVEAIVSRVMQNTAVIAPQTVQEVSCELQRLMILPAFWNFQEKFQANTSDIVVSIKAKIEALMDPTVKFEKDREEKVVALLKESEQYVGGLGISDSERVMIVRAMGFRQGHWYKCPNGHVYCISECGGAMMESKCPECGASIGGSSHRLRGDNAVASEMDGAHHAAWSEHNNLGNFVLNNN